MTRSASLRVPPLPAILSILVAVPAAAQPALEALRLETLATDLPGSPVAMTHAGDERVFVTLKEGLVLIWDGERILDEPFLDLRGQVALQFEQGLLSLAFHPDYDDNGLFFVDYTNAAGNTVVARFRVSDDDPNRADPDSREVVLFVDQPTPIHNGGQLQFGPDGFLYIGMGDGGSARDPFCNAQRRDTILGKMLRIDVDVEATEPPFYEIPDDNPFAGPGDPPDEVWALGLRNPWRFSFDRLTGDLFIADVGQGAREEVDFQPADSPGGENYGWKRMEGTLCQNDQNCPLPVPPCDDPAYSDPIVEIDHSEGDCAVVGGYVYRGGALPGVDGVYFFGDFCSGIVRAAQRSGEAGEEWEVRDLPLRVPALTSFGEAVDGEIYLSSLRGDLLRLRSVTETGTCTPGPDHLCLLDGRFRVEARWEIRDGGSGLGTARPLTDDTGSFWFFDPDNLELVVKMIDACEPFDRFWVFAGGLTNVEVQLKVVDTEAAGTGQEAVRRYTNPLGTPFRPIQDTAVFDTCP